LLNINFFVWNSIVISPALILSAIASAPGAYSIILDENMIRIRTLLIVRHIPRDYIAYIGLRQRDAWLVRIFPALGGPPDFQSDGRPPPAYYISVEYNTRLSHNRLQKKS